MRGAPPLLPVVGCVLALLLAGCAQPATPEPTSDPSPSASPAPSPSARPSAGPTASATTEPAATPTVIDPPSPSPVLSPTASPAPGPAASPPASPPAAPPAADTAPYCGDEYVLTLLRTGIVGWEGDREQQLAMAQPQPTFEPADALAGLDVVCVVTYRIPVDDEPAVAVVSEAVLERDADAFDELADWASEHYYEVRSRQGGSFVEREAPRDPDGTPTRKIFWAPLDGDEPTIVGAAEIVRLTGAAPDAILVWHADFTRE